MAAEGRRFGSLQWKLLSAYLGEWRPSSSGTWASGCGGDMHDLDRRG